ncbi:MAG TPA: FAD-binding oxidoreductase [Acidimicrobiales bacterium]
MTGSVSFWDGHGSAAAAYPWPTHTDATLEADLLVVGLGASGLAAVHEGVDRGLRVIGVDAGTVAGGAAGRNAGFALAGLAEFHHDVVAKWGRERAVAAYRLTLAELDAMEADPASTFRRVGSLRVAASAGELDDCRAHLAALARDGFPGDWYAGIEGEGVLLPADGVVDPLARARSMADAAAGRGARLFERTAWPACVDDGRVRAATTVLAIDGLLDRVVPEVADRVRTTRLQVLATAPVDPPGRPRYPRPVYRRYGYDYWQQLPTGEIVLGGCRDRFEGDEWDAPSAEATDDVQACLDRLLREVVLAHRDEPPVVTHRWAGLVAYTDDRLPVIEEVRPGVVACGAYSGTGNVVGVLAGRAAVALAVDGASPVADLLAGR